jgi:hypothetical protein
LEFGQDLAIAESQLRDYQARLGKPFLHDAYLSELTGLRDQLKSGLSATAQTQDHEAGPSVSDLAGRIKTLKAAHSVEAAPQRIRQKQSTAEEPVTARIRRRQEADTGAGEAVGHDSGVGKGETPESRGKPPMTFQERIAMERRGKDEDHQREPDQPSGEEGTRFESRLMFRYWHLEFRRYSAEAQSTRNA